MGWGGSTDAFRHVAVRSPCMWAVHKAPQASRRDRRRTAEQQQQQAQRPGHTPHAHCTAPHHFAPPRTWLSICAKPAESPPKCCAAWLSASWRCVWLGLRIMLAIIEWPLPATISLCCRRKAACWPGA